MPAAGTGASRLTTHGSTPGLTICGIPDILISLVRTPNPFLHPARAPGVFPEALHVPRSPTCTSKPDMYPEARHVPRSPTCTLKPFMYPEAQSAQFLTFFKALADATRLRLVRVLQVGPFNVNELVGILGVGQSRVSRHLKILADAGLVSARREGSWVYYRLSSAWSSDGSGRASGATRVLESLGAELENDLGPEASRVKECLDGRRDRAESFFRGVADQWDRERDRVVGPPVHVEPLLETIGASSKPAAVVETIVDLGTGTGLLLEALSRRAEKVIGIDASAEMLRVAGDNLRDKNIANVELRLGSLEHLPLSDGEADRMVANMVLHHVAQPEEALLEVRRGLGPNGTLHVADFRTHDREDYRELLGDWWLGFDPLDLERWLRSADLEWESYEEVPSEADTPDVFVGCARRISGAETHAA